MYALYLVMLLTVSLTYPHIPNTHSFYGSKFNNAERRQDGELGKIFAINEPLALIVKDIVGKHFNVDSILPPGVDPHSFQLTPDIVNELARAKLIVLIDPENFGLEKKIFELDSLKHVPKLFLENYTKFGWTYLSVNGFGVDYHGSWLSPRNGLSVAAAVKEALSERFPEIKSDLENNFSSFKEGIGELIENLEELASKHKAKNYNAISMIPPLAYIANWTGLRVDEIVLSEPDQELSLSRYTQLVDKLKKTNNYIILAPKEFKDTKVGELAEQLARESGSPLVYVPVFSVFGLNHYIEFLELAMYPVFSVIGLKYSSGESGGDVSLYIQIALVSILIIAILEAYVIYEYKRKEWELAEVEEL